MIRCENCGCVIVPTYHGWEHDDTGAAACWGFPPAAFADDVATPREEP